MTFVHMLCYFTHSYTLLVALNTLFSAALLVLLTHPHPYICPLHTLFLAQPVQVFLGSRLYSRTHRDRTLYSGCSRTCLCADITCHSKRTPSLVVANSEHAYLPNGWAVFARVFVYVLRHRCRLQLVYFPHLYYDIYIIPCLTCPST